MQSLNLQVLANWGGRVQRRQGDLEEETEVVREHGSGWSTGVREPASSKWETLSG